MSADNTAQEDHSHESMIKTPQQLLTVTVLAFVVPVVFLILMAQFVINSYKSESGAQVSAETVAARIKPVAEVNVASGDAGAGGARSGEDIVKNVCSACHGTGAAGAPKIGDKSAWGPRIAHGLKELVATATKGKGAMPPKGGASDLSDFELTRAIIFMANQSGGSFKEPAQPASSAAAPAAKK
ncbi:MAG TPA: c-type cytochrome [Burkholderiales bacterium]|nr:c-type cytochrome [Burkholderiales bacterium]